MDTRGLAELLKLIAAGLVVLGAVVAVAALGGIKLVQWLMDRGGR